MLTSVALLFLCGMLLGRVFERLHLPRLLGFLLTGIALGPYALGWMDETLLLISADLRQVALVIILTRAGLSLRIEDLKRVGRPAILMCFVPACFELVGMVLIAPRLLHISVLEAAIVGTVVAAVSPAVIVPRMLQLMKEGYGTEQSIPQMIVAGASVDDVFVIVLFTAATGMAQGARVSAQTLLQVPLSIGIGILLGIGAGALLHRCYQMVRMRDSAKVIVLLSVSFLLLALEQRKLFPVSGLLAIMSMGIVLQKKETSRAVRLSQKYEKLWVAAEVLLFVLVGATVDLNYALAAGASAILVILGALLFRMLGVLLCLVKTNLTRSERLFCMIAYLPKATVQAAIGALPLSMGLPCGDLVLTVAILSILITAPLGAVGIDVTYARFLKKGRGR